MSHEQYGRLNIKEPIHLVRRDRIAVVFRVAGALLGFGVIAFAFATSSWNNPWVVVLFCVVVVGGALAYYLLTSIVRCPSCSARVSNFRIGALGAERKEFACGHCGAKSWLKEGFYWQREFSA